MMSEAPSPTVSGFEAVNQPHGQVAFGSELRRFLPHVNDHLGEALPLVQLDQSRGTERGDRGWLVVWKVLELKRRFTSPSAKAPRRA